MIMLLMGIVIPICIVLGGLAAYPRLARKRKKSPQQLMKELINQQTIGLNSAVEALLASKEYVYQLEQEATLRETDISVLETKIKELIVQGNDEEAKLAIVRLQIREKDLQMEESRITKAKEEHKKYALIVDEYRQEIKKLRQESKELEFRSKLAIADKQVSGLISVNENSMHLQQIREELETQISKDSIEAQINRSIGNSAEEHFLLESTKNDNIVNNRLIEFKKEIA